MSYASKLVQDPMKSTSFEDPISKAPPVMLVISLFMFRKVTSFEIFPAYYFVWG